MAASLPGQHRCYAVDVRDRQALHAAATDFIAFCQGRVDVVIASAGISAGTLTEHGGTMTCSRPSSIPTCWPPWRPSSLSSARCATPAAAAGGNFQRGRRARAAGGGRLQRVQVGGDDLLRKPEAGTGGDGIRVVTIAPGYIKTAMTAHNPYSMPFLMDAGDFARRAHVAIERGASYRVIPWQMGVVARLMRLLPNAVYDRLARNAPRKPRKAG